MIDFYELEQSITDYIKENYTACLNGEGLGEQLPIQPVYVSDVLDLDKYKGNLTVFFDFSNFTFEDLSNESQSASVTLDLYFVRRNGTSETLKKDLLNYVSKFYAWFYSDRSLGGIVDFGTITELNNYSAASGDKGIKISQITIQMQLEDD